MPRYLRKKDGSDPTLHIYTKLLAGRGDMEIVEEEDMAAEKTDTAKIGNEEQIGPYIIRKYSMGWYEVLEVVERKLRKADAECLVAEMMAACKGGSGESSGAAGEN